MILLGYRANLMREAEKIEAETASLESTSATKGRLPYFG
jgi:hypothetical protein